jgi:hypothetical protein
MVNYNDVAGQYAGLVFGMANTFGTIPGFIAPAIVGAITTKVFYLVTYLFFFKYNSLKLNIPNSNYNQNGK